MKLFGLLVTKKCLVSADAHSIFCSGDCNGTGQVLTAEGKKLIQFIRDHGEFADEQHMHSIS